MSYREEPKTPKICMACPTWNGGEYALKRWAEAFHAQTYPNKVAFMADNSIENLHYLHKIRAEGIEARWMPKTLPYLWDTLELAWTEFILPYAHDAGCEFVFSVEHDVIVPPEAMEKMYQAAIEHAREGKAAVVSQRYNPRGQPGIDFNWDTLGCTLLPVEPLYRERLVSKAIYEVECFIVTTRNGHPRFRTGDLFEVEHLKSPLDPRPADFESTPAHEQYLRRKIAAAEARGEDVSGLMMTMKRVNWPPQAPGVPPDSEPIEALAEAAPVGESTTEFETAEGEVKQLAGGGHIVGAAVPVQDAEMEGPPLDVPVSLQYLDSSQIVRELVMKQPRIRLNIGCGHQQIAGFLGVDFDPAVSPDIVAKADSLPVESDTVDMVYASHILEHLDYDSKALQEWLRVLKPGGFLDVIVPNVIEVYSLWRHQLPWGDYQLLADELYVNASVFGGTLLAERIPEMKDMYGGPGHQHKQIFLFDMLVNRVIDAGFVEVHESSACFLRKSSVGETLVQARKPWLPVKE